MSEEQHLEESHLDTIEEEQCKSGTSTMQRHKDDALTFTDSDEENGDEDKNTVGYSNLDIEDRSCWFALCYCKG